MSVLTSLVVPEEETTSQRWAIELARTVATVTAKRWMTG
jgi:hypothetical protein